MADDKTKFVADDGYSEVPQPVTPEGGDNKEKKSKKGEVEVKKSDVKTPGQEKAGEKVPTAEEVETTETEEVVEEVVEVESTIESIFEGTELSDEFKQNIKLVFEAAVNEEVATKTESLKEELEVINALDLMVAMDSGNAHLAAMQQTKTITLWGVTHPYAGFAPFHQPSEYCLVSDLKKYPKIPCSVYGNKVINGYENVIESISPTVVIEKIMSVLNP